MLANEHVSNSSTLIFKTAFVNRRGGGFALVTTGRAKLQLRYHLDPDPASEWKSGAQSGCELDGGSSTAGTFCTPTSSLGNAAERAFWPSREVHRPCRDRGMGGVQSAEVGGGKASLSSRSSWTFRRDDEALRIGLDFQVGLGGGVVPERGLPRVRPLKIPSPPALLPAGRDGLDGEVGRGLPRILLSRPV